MTKSPPEQEPSDTEGNNPKGVLVPEDFQQATSNLMKQASTKHHVNHVQSQIDEKRTAMRDAEDKQNKSKIPESFSMDDGPGPGTSGL